MPDTVGSRTVQWVIAMEWCGKGDLHDNVQANGPFFEEHAVEIAVGVLAALDHIHARGIVHRDVKAENILLSENNRPLLADFGIASRVDNEEVMKQRCGSPGYAAPEILSGLKYNDKVDVFSTGVVLYFILCRSLPFSGADIAFVLSRTLKCKVRFPTESFGHISPNMKQFVRLLMHKEPNDRLSAQRAMRIAWHHWCRDRLESATWLHDIKLQVKQRRSWVDAGKADAPAELSPEHVTLEGIEDPSGNMNGKSVKHEVPSASHLNHSDLLKMKRIPAVASTTCAVEQQVASTFVEGPSASDIFVEDPAAVKEKAQEETEFCKSSRMRGRPWSIGTPSSSKADSLDVIFAREASSEISNGRQDIREALALPEPEVIQESEVKPLRFFRKKPKSQTHALSDSVAEVEQPAMTPTPPLGRSRTCRRPPSIWRKLKKHESPIRASFHLTCADAEFERDARHCSLEDKWPFESHRHGSASPRSTDVAPAGSVTNPLQYHVFCRKGGESDEAPRDQSGINGTIPRGRRFFAPLAARLGGRQTYASDVIATFDDGERPSFKARPTNWSERVSHQAQGRSSYTTDASEGVSSYNSEDIFGNCWSRDQNALDGAQSHGFDGCGEKIL